MKNKIIAINLTILAMITVLALIVLLRYYNETPNEKIVCIEPKISIEYEACYNLQKNSIQIKISNNENRYDIKKMSIEFKDSLVRSFEIFPIPKKSSSEWHYFSAEKNPVRITLKTNIGETLLGTCNKSTEIILLKYCNNLNDVSINLNVNDGSSVSVENTTQNSDSDILSPELIEKDELFASSCKSNWICLGWEECIGGIQRRDCSDLSKCLIPSETPEFTKFCDGSCKENWQCEWSRCINGYTHPVCKDNNNCNTEFSKPSPIPCSKSAPCIPEISCTDWSVCKTSYSFEELLSGIEELNGKKSRYCFDSNKCILPVIEEDYCSSKVDITTKEVILCGRKYLEVRDRLTGNLLSRVDYSVVSNKMDISLFLSDEPEITC